MSRQRRQTLANQMLLIKYRLPPIGQGLEANSVDENALTMQPGQRATMATLSHSQGALYQPLISARGMPRTQASPRAGVVTRRSQR